MNNDDANKFDPDDGWYPWPDVVECRNNDKTMDKLPDPEGLVPRIKTCLRCGGPVERFYFMTPGITWVRRFGQAGWMEACFSCKKQIGFELDVIN